MIAFSCPACGCLYEVSDDRVGSDATCLKCGQRMLVPSPTANQARLGRPVQNADWRGQPPPQRGAAAPVKAREDEGPKSPSPYYPYWMSDERVREWEEYHRERLKQRMDVLRGLGEILPVVVFLVLVAGVALAGVAALFLRNW
jgi:hypothetical protein